MMKKVILILTLILAVSAMAGSQQRKFKIAFRLPGNGSTQYMVVEAPDSMTAQQIFKATCTECKFVSYTELR